MFAFEFPWPFDLEADQPPIGALVLGMVVLQPHMLGIGSYALLFCM